MIDDVSSDTKEALKQLHDELAKAMPDWLAERVMDAIDTLIDSKIADFVEFAADRIDQARATPPNEGEAMR